MAKNIKNNWLIICILLLAAILRLWGLSKNPVALFGDEYDLGYQAYSILKTGRDYSGNFMPLHFQSLAEWRTPLYLYSAVPTVAIFGISPLGVRLPAAIFGILSIYVFYLLIYQLTKNKSLPAEPAKLRLSLVSAFLLAISPWHLQYSRAGFEVTFLLLFLLSGLYCFFKSLHNSKYLIPATVFLTLTPWIYSTAKLFTPLLMIFLLVTWRKAIIAFPKKHLVFSFLAFMFIGLPVAFSTLFGGGSQRFGYVSVFTDPEMENNIGMERLVDARIQGGGGRLFHNKFTYWGETIINNYLGAFSTNFLFVKGDPNVRHSIGTGEFYKIDFFLLILGIVLFFTYFKDKKIKFLFAFWLLVGVLPSAITRDGGNHASRLILILPPLIFLVAYGFVNLNKYLKYLYLAFIFLSFIFYFHRYSVHYPQASERWWHYGWGESFKAIKQIEKDYDRIFISMSGEPAWIFTAGAYEYPPNEWHKGYPFADTEVEGFGGMSYIGKFYFGSPDEDGAGLYGLHKYITPKDLYLANAKESGENLIIYPDKVPVDLKLIKAVAFPSGEPAFYIFSKN